MNCCRSCKGPLQICRQHSCPCHKQRRDKNPNYTTETYRNPTAWTAINRADKTLKEKSKP